MSGAGVSMKSTWPVSSALLRVTASGAQTRMMRSALGMRAGFQ